MKGEQKGGRGVEVKKGSRSKKREREVRKGGGRSEEWGVDTKYIIYFYFRSTLNGRQFQYHVLIDLLYVYSLKT